MTTSLPPRPEEPPKPAEPRSLLEEQDEPSHVRIQVSETDAVLGKVTGWVIRHPWVRKAASAIGVMVLAAMATYGTYTVHQDSSLGEQMDQKLSALAESQRKDTKTIVATLEKLAETVARLDKESQTTMSEQRVIRVEMNSLQKQIDAHDRQISSILRRKWMDDQ